MIQEQVKQRLILDIILFHFDIFEKDTVFQRQSLYNMIMLSAFGSWSRGKLSKLGATRTNRRLHLQELESVYFIRFLFFHMPVDVFQAAASLNESK